MKTTTSITAIFSVLAMIAGVSAQEAEFDQRHQAGVRLGAWANMGDKPASEGDLFVNGVVSGSFETNIASASFLFEGFYAHRLSRRLLGEASLGITNRGSVTLSGNDGATDVGNLMIYSLLLSAKFYPGTIGSSRLYPYLQAGGGLFIGRRTVQFTNAGYYATNWEEESAYKIEWMAGAGIDIPLASSVGLEFNAKYYPVCFSKPLVTITEYEALEVSVGIK